MCDLGVDVGRLGVAEGALCPRDALVELGLVVEAAGVADLELDPVLERAGPVAAAVQQAQGAVEPLEPLLAAAEPLDGVSHLPHQARGDDELAGRELERSPVGLLGPLVAREQLCDVAERLENRDHLVARELGQLIGRGQRALVQLGRDDIRVLRLGAAAGHDGVPPRLFVLARLQEVERQEGRVSASFLERGADLAVDLSAPAERQPLVRHRPEEVVAEAERFGGLALDELREPLPALEVAGLDRLVDEDLLKQVDVEAWPDDRRVAQEQPVCRVEPVDARRE